MTYAMYAPFLERISARSYHTQDIDQLISDLHQAGATNCPPALHEAARLTLTGGLCMVYHSGAVVIGGATPGPLLHILDRFCGTGGISADTLLTKRGDRWFTTRPDDLVLKLATRHELRPWIPPKPIMGERWRAYLTGPSRTAIIVQLDGWVRITGDNAHSAHAILETIVQEGEQ